MYCINCNCSIPWWSIQIRFHHREVHQFFLSFTSPWICNHKCYKILSNVGARQRPLVVNRCTWTILNGLFLLCYIGNGTDYNTCSTDTVGHIVWVQRKAGQLVIQSKADTGSTKKRSADLFFPCFIDKRSLYIQYIMSNLGLSLYWETFPTVHWKTGIQEFL